MKTGGPHLIIYRQTTLVCKRDLQHKAVIVEGVMAVDGGRQSFQRSFRSVSRCDRSVSTTLRPSVDD
jgi:hypothetical protein